jgi:hypothetical protein
MENRHPENGLGTQRFFAHFLVQMISARPPFPSESIELSSE